MESLLNKISKSNNNIYVTGQWANGLFGAIVDVENNCIYRFVDYILSGNSFRQKYLTDEEKISCPIVACGIVAFWIKYHKQLGIKQLFENYYNIKLSQYKLEHECDDDAWNRELEEEFITRHCTKQEKNLIKLSEPILSYLSESDVQRIKSVAGQFLSFARSKRNELIAQKYPADKRIQNTFLATYSHGGAYHCIEWFRKEYNLPPSCPKSHAGEQGTYTLNGKWKTLHDIEIPEYIQEEYDDFDDSVLIYSNGGLMDEIHQAIEKCSSTEDRVRYIATLLQPFKSFSEAFYANGLIKSLEKSILQHKEDMEIWKNVPDDATDSQNGEPLDPLSQINACLWFIERDQKEIEYLKLVESKFFDFAQKGLNKDFGPNDNQAMFISLGAWFSLMIRFSRSLAALALTYGIKLMDVQEQISVYINWTYDLTDYLDDKFITSFEQVKSLLSKISKNETKGSEMTEYEKILNIIYSGYTVLQQHPPKEVSLDEVSLRDQILMPLQVQGYSATAESFNRSGKTDIIIKNRAGLNLFIGECKIWHGKKELLTAINQLFTYLTWQDTEAALIIFVESSNFIDKVESAKKYIASHPLFVSHSASRLTKENTFSCIMHHSDDVNRNINLEVLLFHFPKKGKASL